MVGKYLEIIKNKECIGFLRKGDLRGEFLLKSFGIKNFYYYNYGGILIRIKYLIKALNKMEKDKYPMGKTFRWSFISKIL